MALADFIDFNSGMEDPQGSLPNIIDALTREQVRQQNTQMQTQKQEPNAFAPGKAIPFSNSAKMWQYLIGRLFSGQLADKPGLMKAIPGIGAGVKGAQSGTNMISDVMGMTQGGSILKAILGLVGI